jgi:undecaprenyl-diphosphatase
LFGQAIKGIFETPSFVGGLFIVTGLLLLLTRFLPAGDRAVTAKRAFIMGLGQALALLPGISRSGTTLVCARACRVAPEKAAEFSFLMSAPLILGAVLLETLEAFSAEAAASASPSWPLTVYGSLLAAVVGYFSLSLLVRALKGAWFWLFGPYCLAVGVLTLLLA